MNIELKEITVREITEKYTDSEIEGVYGYGGNLNIRPAYQREFVYKDKQRDAVIETVLKGFPLNTMYWSKNEDGTYEVLDGQQRTISICQYVAGKFHVAMNDQVKYFSGLPNDIKERFLSYKLMIYVCEGTESEKLDWFKVINIAGVALNDQELRNAVYTGKWLTDAKNRFSKPNCAAYNTAKDYVAGTLNRQEYLETALDWVSEGAIEEYMAMHQNDSNATALWLYFDRVITWVRTMFPTYRKEMKGVSWGKLFNKYGDLFLDVDKLEAEVSRLMADEDVTKKSGIYAYLLSGEEKYLSIRAFTQRDKRTVYEKQGGICCHCQKKFPLDYMEADHITPWSQGGKTLPDNCQMLCRDCNRRKSAK